MSFKCPECKGKLRCVDSRQISKLTTWRHYYCKVCDLMFISIDTLDPIGYKKRNYRKVGE